MIRTISKMSDRAAHRKCRACLANNYPAELFDWREEISTSEITTYAQFFHQCTRLEAADELPQLLCEQCKSELRIAYAFVQKALEADRTLRKELANIEQPEEGLEKDEIFEFVEIDEDVAVDVKLSAATPEQHCDSPLDRLSTCTGSPTEEPGILGNECEVKTQGASKEKIRCQHCNKQLLKKNLAGHIQASHVQALANPEVRTENGVELCQYCKKRFPKQRLARHVLDSHGEKTAASQPCELCGKAFTRVGLYQHMRQVHPAHKWLCDVCSRTFKAKRTLERHMLSHSETRERNYPCEICTAKFYCKASRDHHMRLHGQRKAEFSCDDCSKVFFTKGGLTTHKKLHTARNFVCDICQKSFPRIVDLKRHRSVHSDERPYRCSECPKTFRKQFLYKTHLLEHQGHRWKCEYCSKEFTALAHFREHRKFHLLAKPRCLMCDTEWTKLYRVRRHIRQVHKLTDSEEIDRHVFLPPKKILVPRIRVAEFKEVVSSFKKSNKNES